ncbi:MAG: hypothetical protein SGBAC_009608 [Bacillariaceae sp.]
MNNNRHDDSYSYSYQNIADGSLLALLQYPLSSMEEPSSSTPHVQLPFDDPSMEPLPLASHVPVTHNVPLVHSMSEPIFGTEDCLSSSLMELNQPSETNLLFRQEDLIGILDPVLDINGSKRTSDDLFSSIQGPCKRQRTSPVEAAPGERSVVRFRPYQEKPWREQFTKLVQFKLENGHCCVPHAYPKDPVLARWVKRQRYQYKKMNNRNHTSTMTTRRFEELESVGFVWHSHASAWQEKLNELMAFKQSTGHCNVPSNFPANVALSTWVKCQRRQYKRYASGSSSTMTMARFQFQSQSQSQTPSDKILFRLETEHPKVLIGMLMSFGSSSPASSSSSSTSRSQRSQKASANTQATITQSMMLLNGKGSGTASSDLSASIGQMTIYTTETGLQLHQSSNLSSQSSMELPKELFSYYQTSASAAAPSSTSLSAAGATQASSRSQQSSANANANANCCCCISWKPLRNALILAMTQNPTKLSMTYNINDEVLHVETECGGAGLIRRRSTNNVSTSSSNNMNTNTSFTASTGVVCTAVVSGLVPPEEQPQLSQAFLQQPIVARILVPSNILMDVLELALVSPMAIQLQWKTTTLVASESKKSVLQVTAVGPCSECAVQWQIPIEWANHNNIEMDEDDQGDDDYTVTTDNDTRMSSLDGGRGRRSRKRKSHQNAKRTVRKVKHSYPYEAWAQAMKPLLDSQAHETCISVNEQGILAIQHQLLCHDNIAAFCDGLLVPLIVEDEDDGSDANNTESDDDRTDASSMVSRSGRKSAHGTSSAGSSSSWGDHRTAAHFTPSASQSTIGNDDQEDDTGTNHSQPRIDLSRKRQQSLTANDSQGIHDDDDDDDDDCPQGDAANDEPSFFGTLPVVNDTIRPPAAGRLSNVSNASASSSRREQRKRLRAQQRLSAGSPEVEPSASSEQLSPVVLPSSSSPPSILEDNDDDHLEPTQTQDDEEERYCSSPEVVYGKM